MKIRLVVTAFFLGLFSIATAQDSNILTKGNKKYPATSVWTFICEDYKYNPNLEIQIAKTETGGLMKLAIDVSNVSKQIGGRVYIVLQNGDFIYCSDKGIREFADGKSIAYYTLSAQEMAKLKGKNIQNIRFRIIGKDSNFGSDIGYFTATNKKEIISSLDNSLNKWETMRDIQTLIKSK